MEIKINCKGSKEINWKELKSFQGNLKKISQINLDKLKKSIIKYGFSAPIFIWGDNILDGHQRLRALEELSKEYTIPEIPVVEIYAQDEKEAKEKLLRIASQYGEFTVEGIDEYFISNNIPKENLESIRFSAAELVYPPDGIFHTNPDGSLEEYKEPEEKTLTCPHCKYTGLAKEF